MPDPPGYNGRRAETRHWCHDVGVNVASSWEPNISRVSLGPVANLASGEVSMAFDAIPS